MKFILTAGWEDGVADLTQRLVRELAAGKQVLWLVSGGSNIPASVEIMGKISATLSKGLSIMLADERYGPVGHSDSNWAQLLKAGLVAGKAQLLPVLRPGNTFKQTIDYYNKLAARAFKEADIIIAQLGIGDDGHIAGILPDSPAASEDKALVVGYEHGPFKRVTLTFPAFRQISAAYAFAFGSNKHNALASLQGKARAAQKQPAQILKALPEAYLYNDQVGAHA